MEAEPAREEAVAVRDVEHVLRRAARCGDRAGADVGEDVDVAARVGDDRRLAARARGGVDTHSFFQGRLQQAERIRVAQLRLGRERELLEGRFGLVAEAREERAEPLLLQGTALLHGLGLQLGLEQHGRELKPLLAHIATMGA